MYVSPPSSKKILFVPGIVILPAVSTEPNEPVEVAEPLINVAVPSEKDSTPA